MGKKMSSAAGSAAGAARPDAGRAATPGIWRSILAQYADSPAPAKVAIWLMLASHLPLLLATLSLLPYPFDVGTVAYQHMGMVSRIVHGLPLYTGSSSEHSVVTYTPLYWYVIAGLAKLFGLTFFCARIVTFAASVATWLGVAAFVWVNTQRNLMLTVAAPTVLYLSSLLMNNWTADINVNALHFALVVWGFFVLRPPLANGRVVAGAVLLVLGVLTKQTGLAYVAAAGCMVLLSSPKRAALFASVSAVLLGLSFLWLQKTSDGQFYIQTGPANAQLPWMASRIVDEILLRSFLGYGGVLAVATVVALVAGFQRNIFLMGRVPHFVMLAGGTVVACIAHPKYGSGNVHDVVALAGICVCGGIGLHVLWQKVGPEFGARVASALVLVQTGALLLAGVGRVDAMRIHPADEMKYAQLANVFQAGRTCVLGMPYIQQVFHQPESGVADDEFSKWRNGRLDYSRLPDLYVKPFRDQVFDYVVITDYFDPQHPVCKAILENYPQVSMRIPETPPGGSSMRHEMVVLRAKRLATGARVR